MKTAVPAGLGLLLLAARATYAADDAVEGRVLDARTGKPVAGFWIEGNGDIATVAAASRKAKEYVHFASEKVREECPLTDVWVAAKWPNRRPVRRAAGGIAPRTALR